MQVYTPEQANRLLEAAQGDRLESLYILMLTTTCRLGELLGLRWSAVDLERGEMQIVTALKEVASKRSLGRPKTPRSRRAIPLTPLAVASLKRHRIKQQEERLKQSPPPRPDPFAHAQAVLLTADLLRPHRSHYSAPLHPSHPAY